MHKVQRLREILLNADNNLVVKMDRGDGVNTADHCMKAWVPKCVGTHSGLRYVIMLLLHMHVHAVSSIRALLQKTRLQTTQPSAVHQADANRLTDVTRIHSADDVSPGRERPTQASMFCRHLAKGPNRRKHISL